MVIKPNFVDAPRKMLATKTARVHYTKTSSCTTEFYHSLAKIFSIINGMLFLFGQTHVVFLKRVSPIFL